VTGWAAFIIGMAGVKLHSELAIVILAAAQIGASGRDARIPPPRLRTPSAVLWSDKLTLGVCSIRLPCQLIVSISAGYAPGVSKRLTMNAGGATEFCARLSDENDKLDRLRGESHPDRH
jgi:hypothetical protein